MDIVIKLCLSVLAAICFVGAQLPDTQNNLGNGPPQGIILQGVDEDEQITRPCPQYDVNCIRKYFAKHAKCHIQYGPVPEPLFRPASNFYFPSFNISASQIELTLRGLNAEVAQFYIEEKSQQVVLQLRFRDFEFNSTYDVYRFHRSGKEDAVTRSQSYIVFPLASTTTIFRVEDHLDLARSETTADIEAPPRVFFNPSAAIHPDPTVAESFAAYIANPAIVATEGFMVGAPIIAGYFIQYSICDYGLLLF